EVLGSDIETIARTKAGIIKAGSVVVSANQRPEAIEELEFAAEENGSRLLVQGRDFSLTDDRLAVGGRQIDVVGSFGHAYDPAFMPLFGRHHAETAALAIAAVESFFGRSLPEEVMDEGFGQLTSPGRLQLVSADPIVYVDAAHNPHGAEALVRAVTESFAFDEVALVVGVLEEKDASGLLSALAPIAHRVTVTRVSSPRTLDEDRLRELTEEAIPDTPVEVAETLPEALDEARAWASRENGRAVLVVGSVLLAGEAIAHARTEKWGSS